MSKGGNKVAAGEGSSSRTLLSGHERQDEAWFPAHEQAPESSVCRIEKLPPRIMMNKVISRLYTPKAVCIGPLLKGHCAEGKRIKRECFHRLINRGRFSVETMRKAYSSLIAELENAIRQSYRSLEFELSMSREELVDMIVLDGCFIIEVLVGHWKQQGQYLEFKIDLILAQNQIPFFALEELFAITDIPELVHVNRCVLLKEITLNYLVNQVQTYVLCYEGDVCHLAHLLHLHFCCYMTRQMQSPPPSLCTLFLFRLLKKKCSMHIPSSSGPAHWTAWRFLPPAQELRSVHMKFKKKDTSYITDVTFKGRTISIPVFHPDDFSMHMLANLVAIELAEQWPSDKRLFCSYAMFMSELIRSREDSKLLCRKGIIKCGKHLQLDMASFFRHLAELNLGDGYHCHFAELVSNVNCYYEYLSKPLVSRIFLR